MKTARNSNIPKTYRIVSVKDETENVKTFTFDVSLDAKPGQFVMVWIPGVDEVPMSVSMDDGEALSITFFNVGEATSALSKKREGDLIGLRGPFGTRYEYERGRRLILVAGGYGAAPMRFTAHEAAKENCKIDFIMGARAAGRLLYMDDIRKLPNTELHIATDDGSAGYKGYNTELLEKLISAGDARSATVFACGPEPMLKSVSDICYKGQIPCFLSLERYMKCGYGLCGNCCMDNLGIRLCKDGPVVSNEICRKLAEFGKYRRDGLGRKHEL